jgi:hypothetical protein
MATPGAGVSSPVGRGENRSPVTASVLSNCSVQTTSGATAVTSGAGPVMLLAHAAISAVARTIFRKGTPPLQIAHALRRDARRVTGLGREVCQRGHGTGLAMLAR